MSNFGLQLEATAGIIHTRIAGLGRTYPEVNENGVAFKDLLSPARFACYTELICEPVSADLIHLADRYPSSDFATIAGAYEAGIDVSSQFIRIGTALVQKHIPEVSTADTQAILRNSFQNVLGRLMRVSANRAFNVETCHTLHSNETQDVESVQLEFDGTSLNFNARIQEWIESDDGGFCPFRFRMPELFDAMVDTAGKIDWLLPQEFETIDTESVRV